MHDLLTLVVEVLHVEQHLEVDVQLVTSLLEELLFQVLKQRLAGKTQVRHVAALECTCGFTLLFLMPLFYFSVSDT